MDGFELLAYMNRNYPGIPVILMTAFGTPKIEAIVNDMGIFRFLEKPLDINIIADNILAALSIKSTSVSKATLSEELHSSADHDECATGNAFNDFYKKIMP